jgi:hypothetical protein
MLYLSVLILESSCLYCYLFISSCSAINHEPCLYTYFIYMIYMLHMLGVLMIHIVMDFFEISISMVNYLLYIIIIILIYGIKIIRKMPIILTRTVLDRLMACHISGSLCRPLTAPISWTRLERGGVVVAAAPIHCNAHARQYVETWTMFLCVQNEFLLQNVSWIVL